MLKGMIIAIIPVTIILFLNSMIMTGTVWDLELVFNKCEETASCIYFLTDSQRNNSIGDI